MAPDPTSLDSACAFRTLYYTPRPNQDKQMDHFKIGGYGPARRMRQVYLLCTVLFCANSQCSMLFHTLLTEAILCHGGSKELVKILNRVEAVASLETSHRLATVVVQQRISRGILHHRALCIVSIANIDILQSHAFVSSTDGTRRWHGTYVQCVQPLPLSAYLSNYEMVAAGFQPAGKKTPSFLPSSFPSSC